MSSTVEPQLATKIFKADTSDLLADPATTPKESSMSLPPQANFIHSFN
jgi:hypothetical protein